MHLLFPGRHHLLTRFQFRYLKDLIESHGKSDQPLIGSIPEEGVEISSVIFAVTSANHSNTRRNPIAFYLRAMALQDFAEELGGPFYVFGINDVGRLEDFASYTLKFIEHETDGKLSLNAKNTLILCSTPVLEMYEKNGFTIFKAELENRKVWKYNKMLPWELVEYLAEDENSLLDEFVKKHMHPASIRIWERYNLVAKLKILFSDDLISDDGDITETRDYNSYVRQMDEIAELKFSETISYVQPGRIGDIGCAVGSWIKLACEEVHLKESDFYGIEVARALFDICQQRKSNMEFANPNVFFAKKNAITEVVFPRTSMNTIHTSSLTHEIESYGSREDLLRFIQNRFDELRSGGVWINRDVIGPTYGSANVLLRLSLNDGRKEDFTKVIKERIALQNYLDGLCTFAKFKRFAIDFRQMEDFQLPYEIIEKDNVLYIKTSLRNACEFLSKKDYTSNWLSEMHETFCFWTFEDWKKQLQNVGFKIDPQSKAFRNDWIIKNRWVSVAQLYDLEGNEMDFPVTHMIMVARKP